MEELLVLVDRNDVQIGFDTKMQVHRRGALHRAFSILVFDRHSRLLLQRRAQEKYHSAGLWSNSCCGHPRHGEDPDAAAHRRLQEEMGFDCGLREVSTLTYWATVSDELIEHEYDHIYVGVFEGEPQIDPREVLDWKWTEPQDVLAWMSERPGDFTVWFKAMLAQIEPAGLAQWAALAQEPCAERVASCMRA